MKFLNWLKKLFKIPQSEAPKTSTRVVETKPPKVETVAGLDEVVKWWEWCGFKMSDVRILSDVIPFAVQHSKKMKTSGTYKGGWPKGAVVHYTAGRDTKGRAFSTIEGGIKNGYTYLCIDIDGTIVQAHPVSRYGAHAGRSAMTGYYGGLNDDFIGIEINNPGKLKERNGKLYTDFDLEVPRDQARYVTYEAHGCPTGWYKKFSEAQEKSLVRLLLWLYYSSPNKKQFSLDGIVGHHEIAGLKGLGFWRKSDPGGSLWLPMEELRNFLKKITP